VNLERTMKQGQLKEAEDDAKALAIKIAGLKQEMRLYLAQHADPASLDSERLKQLSEDLYRAHQDYTARLHLSTELRNDLGLPRYEPR